MNFSPSTLHFEDFSLPNFILNSEEQGGEQSIDLLISAYQKIRDLEIQNAQLKAKLDEQVNLHQRIHLLEKQLKIFEERFIAKQQQIAKIIQRCSQKDILEEKTIGKIYNLEKQLEKAQRQIKIIKNNTKEHYEVNLFDDEKQYLIENETTQNSQKQLNSTTQDNFLINQAKDLLRSEEDKIKKRSEQEGFIEKLWRESTLYKRSHSKEELSINQLKRSVSFIEQARHLPKQKEEVNKMYIQECENVEKRQNYKNTQQNIYNNSLVESRIKRSPLIKKNIGYSSTSSLLSFYQSPVNCRLEQSQKEMKSTYAFNKNSVYNSRVSFSSKFEKQQVSYRKQKLLHL